MTMNKIFVKTHLGLGDNIVCNGMIRKISESYPDYEIHCASKSHNFENVHFMFRDNSKIKVLEMDDNGVQDHLSKNKYDIFVNCSLPSYQNYINHGDDSFYLQIQMDPSVKKQYFYLERDFNSELDLYKKLTDEIGTEDYIFIHEKPNENKLVDRNKIRNDLKIITAKPEYKIFDFLTIIERAKEVHVISSCFLSLFMTKKYNDKTFAHMYVDRFELSGIVKKNNIDIIL